MHSLPPPYPTKLQSKRYGQYIIHIRNLCCSHSRHLCLLRKSDHSSCRLVCLSSLVLKSPSESFLQSQSLEHDRNNYCDARIVWANNSILRVISPFRHYALVTLFFLFGGVKLPQFPSIKKSPETLTQAGWTAQTSTYLTTTRSMRR